MKKIITSLFVGGALLGQASAGSAQCPTLNLSTLPKAACANTSSPFKTGPLSKMNYVASTPCPSGIGLRKGLQSAFKGKKDYPGTMSHSTPGQIACVYNLTPDWRNALVTTDTHLKIVAQITNPDQVNHLAPAVCPQLASENIDELKDPRQEITIEGVRKEGLAYHFRAGKLQSAGAGAHVKGFFGGAPKNLPVLKGQLEISKPFQMECQYQHNTGGKPTTLTLVGTQK